MTHYAISFYVINQAYGDGHPFYWIPPSKHIKMQLATPHVAEQLNRYPKLTENKIQEMCQENGVFATSFRHLLQPSMAKLCLWETLLGFMDETTARLMEKFRNFCKGKCMSRMFAYLKNTLHKLWI